MLPKLIDTGGFLSSDIRRAGRNRISRRDLADRRIVGEGGLKSETVTNLAIYCALAGMAGAKLLMFLFDWRIYLLNPPEIFTLATLQAAGVYQGGLILAILIAFVYMRSAWAARLLTADVFAPGLALGHAIGRLGCLRRAAAGEPRSPPLGDHLYTIRSSAADGRAAGCATPSCADL